MRLRFLPLFLILFALRCLTAKGEAPDFGTAFLPTFSFTESYLQTVAFDTDFQEYAPKTQSRLVGTFRISTQGVNVNTFQVDPDATIDDAVMLLQVGNLSVELALADGEKSTDAGGKQVVKWTLSGTNPDTFETIDEAGQVTLRYGANDLTVTIVANNVPDDYNIMAPDEAGAEETVDDFPVFFSFNIGDYEFTDATVYIDGEAKIYEKTVGSGDNEETFSDLPDVQLNGEIDVVKPIVQFLSPANNAVVTSNTVDVSGTTDDEHGVFEVRVQVNDGAFVPATLGPDGRWSLNDVQLAASKNTITVKAIDFSGNESVPVSRKVTYSLESQLSVTATGTGSGTVTGFLDPIQYTAGQPAPVRMGTVNTGTTVTLTAKPAPGSVFDGWISNKTLTSEQATSPRLVFTMEPNAMVTARFLENPFSPVKGKYNGLITSSDAPDRGFLVAKLSSSGSFSLTAKIGKLTIPLKGIFTGSGHYVGHKDVKGVTYVFDLTVSLAPGGTRIITGTVVGGDVAANLSIDLAPFKKKTAPVPGELVGTFNVLIPAEAGSDATYPTGIGYGRVTVNTAGKVKFAGKLGDGTALSLAASLTGQSTWPFFASLYSKQGSISGVVTFDVAHSDHDLSATLDWFKPAGAKPKTVHPDGFSGQSTLAGARFTPPPKGSRIFLEASAGLGVLSLDAAADATLPALAVDLSATLDTANKLTVTPDAGAAAQNVAVKIVPKTGLFSGSFRESGATRKFNGIIVGSKLNSAGGVFPRGSRPGSISIVAP